MQATSTTIRTGRFTARGETPAIREAYKAVFAARQALVEKLAEQITEEGSPELHSDSSALSTHFRLRHGQIGTEYTQAQVYTHEKGIVVRFWVYGGNFDVRVRDLVLLRLQAGDKGFEVWLGDGEKFFPHEGGKYAMAGQVILGNMQVGR